MRGPAPVVFDGGSGFCKVGFGGDPEMKAHFPTIIGRPGNREVTSVDPNEEMLEKDLYVGNEVLPKQDALPAISWPVQHRMVTDWEDWALVLHHAFYNSLHIAPEDHPVLLTEAPLTPKLHREQTAQILFEKFRVPWVNLQSQAVLSLYATGRTTGLALDSGYGATHAVPVYEGHALTHAILGLDFGGEALTRYMQELLAFRGIEVPLDVACAIKESLAFVSKDFAADLERPEGSGIEEYALPDGRVITVGSERFRCAEALFQVESTTLPYRLLSHHRQHCCRAGVLNFLPKRTDTVPPVMCSGAGVHFLAAGAVEKCDPDIHKDLYANVVLSGGSTLFQNFATRIKHELSELDQGASIKVAKPPERRVMAWIGGSILADTTAQPSNMLDWISREEYDEAGPPVVHRSCLYSYLGY